MVSNPINVSILSSMFTCPSVNKGVEQMIFLLSKTSVRIYT